MSEILKYQSLKFKVFNKTDDEVRDVIKPLEAKYGSIRRLRTAAETTYLPVMRYLLLLYDPGTDLNRDFIRLEDRKSEAAKISGMNKFMDLKFINDIFDNKSPEVLDVIQTLLTEVFHDIDYREWQTLHNELDEYTTARWERTESARRRNKEGEEVSAQTKSTIEALNLKSKLREDCKRIRELIEELDRKIFGDDANLKVIAFKARYMNPESFARAARQNV